MASVHLKTNFLIVLENTTIFKLRQRLLGKIPFCLHHWVYCLEYLTC